VQPGVGQPGLGQPNTAQPRAAPPSIVPPSTSLPGAVQPPLPAGTPASPGYTPAPPVPQTWQPQGIAVLQVLDKVDAQSASLTIKVGQSGKYAALTIAVRACEVSAPTERPDAAAFLDITDSHPDAPSFHGWMLKSAPSVSMLQHPIYDVRVLGCRP
jgi:hypothetical protein